MDNKKIARELVKVAKELVAVREINVFEEMIPTYKKIFIKAFNVVDIVKGVDERVDVEEMKGGSHSFGLVGEWEGVNRQDNPFSIILSLEADKKGEIWVFLEVKTVSGSETLISKSYQNIVPIAEILNGINGVV